MTAQSSDHGLSRADSLSIVWKIINTKAGSGPNKKATY